MNLLRFLHSPRFSEPCAGRIRTPGRGARRAFTLIEVLAATTLLSLVVVLLAGMAREVTSAWVVNQGQTEGQQNVRAVGDIISRDLAGALLPIDSGATDSLQFLLRQGTGTDEIFFQAPVSADSRFGDIAEVGYFIRWVNEESAFGGSRPVARLCRFYVPQTISDPGDPDNPYPNPGFLIYSQSDWLSNVDALAPADASNSYRGMLAENVIGFWARPLDKNGQPIQGSGYDSRNTYTLPAQVEISFVMIDARSAGRVDAGLKDAIVSAAGAASAGADGDASPADRFLDAAGTDEAFDPIRRGLRGYTTRVRLSNSIQ